MNLPNKLTLFRLLCVPVILFLFETEHWLSATIIYTIASLTDFVDGYIARKYNMITDIGIILDPLVDKVFVTTVFIMLVQIGFLPGWAVVLTVAREVLVTGLRTALMKKGKILKAETLGKYKACLQSVSSGCFILGMSLTVYYTSIALGFLTAGYITFWCSLILSMLSGIGYLKYYSSAE